MVSYIPGGNFAKLYSCFLITASCWGGSDHRPSRLAGCLLSGLLCCEWFTHTCVFSPRRLRGLFLLLESLEASEGLSLPSKDAAWQGLPPPVCPMHHLASADAPALTATPAASGQRAGWSVGFLLQIVKKSAWEEVLADSRTSLKGKITTRLEKLNFVSSGRDTLSHVRT